MEDYKSKKDVAEKKVAKVVKGNVKVKKKSSLAGVFISEDASNVKNYVLMDILVPAAKKAISDMVREGVDIFLFGEPGRSRKSDSRAGYVSYRSYSDRDRRDDPRDYRRATYSYNDIVLDSAREAEEVLIAMDEILDEYHVVSVADLYDLVGITGTHVDNKYGWDSMRGASFQRVRDGYLLKLPRAKAI